jgi:hypothetical protein
MLHASMQGQASVTRASKIKGAPREERRRPAAPRGLDVERVALLRVARAQREPALEHLALLEVA